MQRGLDLRRLELEPLAYSIKSPVAFIASKMDGFVGILLGFISCAREAKKNLFLLMRITIKN